MSLITLKNIGKIYVSENSIAVGIRGVNLNFDRGEFVSITGKSGSGKSTLLNVISGMDSYEEGEMYVEGNPTSHYTQLDWENYRRKYISFVFQEYNIVDSFTVLENVELALMDIKDAKVRRKRAIELIKRVGLERFAKQKGSKLSGGQKQRTVIARALAKDSPIILADEPTGNLDTQSAKEITELLHEISSKKLVIVVTHNFEQFESISTRHIRVYDGAIESDQVISTENIIKDDLLVEDKKINEVVNGVHLGSIIFKSKPKLSLFLCTLLIIASLAMFFVSAIFSSSLDLFNKEYMFTPIEGRVVLLKQNGSVITDSELEELKNKFGYEYCIHYDTLLDDSAYWYNEGFSLKFKYAFNEKFGENIIGRYPEKANEIFLYLPITARPYFGKDEIENDIMEINNVVYRIVGIKYFYDTNKDAVISLNEDGFNAMTLSHILGLNGNSYNVNTSLSFQLTDKYDNIHDFFFNKIAPSDKIGKDKILLSSYNLQSYLASTIGQTYSNAKLCIYSEFKTYNYDSYYEYEKITVFQKEYLETSFESNSNLIDSDIYALSNETIFMGMDVINDLIKGVSSASYKQASIFFKSNREASKYIDQINDLGYIAVMSNTTYEATEAIDKIVNSIMYILSIVAWVGCVVFLSFFTNLCTSRSIDSFRPDVAIMRSMGINIKTIKIGVYVRMLIALIPAYIFIAVASLIIFRSPKLSSMFTYLYAWEYVIIYAGMLYMVYRITKKQIKKLFDVSVKKSLRGGANND